MARDMTYGIIASLFVIGSIWYVYTNPPSDSGSVSSSIKESAVRNVVSEFGTKLQMVSLLAPETDRKAAMEANYGSYVAPELIATWVADSSRALGRTSSSPWPEKIDIVEVQADGENYIVEGNVIELANAEGGEAAAAVYPVTLTLEKRDGQWMIVGAEKGAYTELPKRQTFIGYWECLPHKDTSGPQTLECAIGIAIDQSDGHYAIDTRLMSTYPVDFPTGTKVRVIGIVTPAYALSSEQKYDIDGIISATQIEKL